MTTITEFAEISVLLVIGAAIALLIEYSMLRLILGAMVRNIRRSSGFASPVGIPQLQLQDVESRTVTVTRRV